MADDLTRKQKGFVKDYIETGNGTQSALNNYDTNSPKVASVIATENLAKPSIQKAIAEQLPDDLLAKKHLELFDQKRVDYFVFPKAMSNEEIVEHVNAAGIEVITVREGEKGKMAFYSLPDAQAIKNGLEMGYKIKGTFAPEKSINLNLDANIANPRARELAQKYEDELKKGI